jgi:hypothetical protein
MNMILLGLLALGCIGSLVLVYRRMAELKTEGVITRAIAMELASQIRQERGPLMQPEVWLNGELYRAAIMLVHSRHPDGSPRLISYVKEETPIELQGEEEFAVVYCPIRDFGPITRLGVNG